MFQELNIKEVLKIFLQNIFKKIILHLKIKA